MPRRDVENLIILDSYWKDKEQVSRKDWQGVEVLKGDEVIHDPGMDELVQIDNVLEYVKKKYGFEEIVVE